MPDRETLLNRFCRYVRVDTQSDETSETYPSTEKQKDLLAMLVSDLMAAGLLDAAMDERGYVTATLPTNLPKNHPAHDRVPVVGLIAHVDTYSGVTGANVKPQVHRDYGGGDIVLPGDASMVLRVEEEPALAGCVGMTIITSDGTTLLGADDKAGVAEIVEVLWRLKEDPSRLHGDIRVAFTPDEEVGRGTEHFDVAAFGATCAYTLDGSAVGQIENETFCADSVSVTVRGLDVHAGYAKGKMVNAVRVLSDLILALPQQQTPEATEAREGYLHPTRIAGNVSEAKAEFIARDFSQEGLRALEETLQAAAGWMQRKYPGVVIELEIKESYRNMKSILDQHPEVTECAEEAIRRTGHTPQRAAIRGGTDGARLTFLGLPTPNLSCGGMGFHGKKEWVPLEWMEHSVKTVLHLLDIWVERSETREGR